MSGKWIHRLLWQMCLVCAAFSPLAAAEPAAGQITQTSVINALMLGRYDGTTPLSEVLELGNLGLGTVDHLDGELIILDGRAYQARADSTVTPCPPEMTTPFAIVTQFAGDEKLQLPAVDSLQQLEQLLDAQIPFPDLFIAIRLDARFSSIFMRAVARQEPPYRPLAEVVKHQTEWQRENLDGTLIGIRCPKWVTGISVPGYHWHFLSKDRQSGGHVFDCKFAEAQGEFDICQRWVVQLDGLKSNQQDLNQDLSHELEKVERQRGPGETRPSAPSSK